MAETQDKTMIPLHEALTIICNAAQPIGSERVPFTRACGRVLAENVVSDIDMPPFNKSAMDGFACRREDLDNPLSIIETIPVNHVPEKKITAGTCARIMTGAIVPEGADCVIKVEDTETADTAEIRFTGSSTRTNICFKGEDIRSGDFVLNRGICIRPQHIGILASAGCSHPLVSRTPRIGIIVTGNELVEPEEYPGEGQIRNSNGSQLHALSAGIGTPHLYSIAEDTEEAIGNLLRTAMEECDVILFTGGVSMGDYDYVPVVIKNAGIKLLFEKIAIKPGMPTIFGVHDTTYCFGLPGNPVAVFVVFELLVKPFLYALMGCEYLPKQVTLPLETNVTRKRTERQSWLPVELTDNGTVSVLEYHGPAHIQSLCKADGLLPVDIGIEEIPAGTPVTIRLIQ
jgi:molybdopterin molybdotransferase